jgi:GNAT superfamily N-acetyltransferase
MAVEILPLRAEDRAVWLLLWRGYQSFYKTDIATEVTAVTWARLIDPVTPMAGALAWREGVAIGLVHHIRHLSTWTVGDYCYLQDLFVTEAARGGGIGRKLIAYVYDVARAAGCSRVHWLTHETNTDAMQLYDHIGDRSGFVQYRKLF